MADAIVRDVGAGANQQGVRAHNERLILSMIQRHGALPGAELARMAGLSPQTVSVILRHLEADGFIAKGNPQRGHVGKPRVPMQLRRDAAFAVGLKMGRRNAALVLADFEGSVIKHRDLVYPYPTPEAVLEFLETGLADFKAHLGAKWHRVAGLGVARPNEIWQWPDAIGAPPEALQQWKSLNLSEAIGQFSDLPVYLINDATAACQAELVFGRGKEFQDYAHVFVGSFIGGGIVLNSVLHEGAYQNAGAFGPLPAYGDGGSEAQLLDVASLYLLEAEMLAAGRDPSRMWTDPSVWALEDPLVAGWIAQAARHLGLAVLTIAAVIDVETVLIDGAFPNHVAQELARETAKVVATRDHRGLMVPKVDAGTIGPQARELGAATVPFFARYLLNTHNGFGAV